MHKLEVVRLTSNRTKSLRHSLGRPSRSDLVLLQFNRIQRIDIQEGNTQDNANFLKETQNYWQRILREPVDFYQGDLPKTLLESGLAVSDQ